MSAARVARGSLSNKVDVMIVGGGPGGLALANAIKLHAPKLSCKVVERAATTRAKGAGLALAPNGLGALQAISPALHAKILGVSCLPKRSVLFNMEGGVERETMLQPNPAVSSPFIGWSDLQTCLMQQLPEGVLQLGCSFDRFELCDDGVEVHFAEGQPSITAGVLVGCDGYRSQVRQQWLDDGPPAFAGTVCFRGRLKEADAAEMGRESITMDIRGDSVMGVYPGSEDYVVWNLSVKAEALAGLGLSRSSGALPDFSVQNTLVADQVAGDTRKQRAMAVAQRHPPPLRALVELTEASVILEHDVTLRPLALYPQGGCLGGTGPVTLLGDAAHVIRPSGQGTNMAFEDVVDLTRQLQLHGASEAALREYEASRLPRWRIMAAHSEAQTSGSFGAIVDRQQLRSWEQELYTFTVPSLSGQQVA